ncbi:MAG: winged helix-turn-helix domain-containing protein [Longimicrobiales bacterium]
MDRITGLKLGADDYVVKPFSVAEFLERVKARLRESNKRDTSFVLGAVQFDIRRRIATKDGRPIHLTDHEWRLLAVLAEDAGHAVTREELTKRAWGAHANASHRIVDYFISLLRAKIEDEPDAPRLIVTQRGVGYMIVDVDAIRSEST